MTTSFTLGSYRLIAELGSGGMADVYLAAVEGPPGSGFTKLAVVKKLRSHIAEDPEFVAMLIDEARVTARLSHPNVIQLFEVAKVDEVYFLAMEFLEGQPLHRVARRIEKVKRSGVAVPVDVYYAAVADVLAGLHHAHELADYDGTPLGIVHRDVTPHNVFVTYDGVVKVVDFGIAKAAGRITETGQGVVKGKIRYMSPEQACGDEVDRRADIFAAGVMLWNLATGTKLWGDRTDVEVAQALSNDDYRKSPRERCPEVPEEIDAICRKALAHDRANRYASAAAMRAEIEAYLGGNSAEVRKTLATTMKEVFDRERKQLRKLLEASALTSTPSVAKLARRPTRQSGSRQATRERRALARASRPERTEVMPGAPARKLPASGQKSLRAPRSRAADVRRATESRSRLWAYGFAALAIALAVLGRIASGTAARSEAEAPRLEPALVVSELTRSSHVGYGKAARSDKTDNAPRSSVAHGSSGTPAAPTGRAPAASEPAARASVPATNRAPGSIDSSDPWSSIKR